MTLYNKVWRATYTLAFGLVAYLIFSSCILFEIEFAHPIDYELFIPDCIPRVEDDPIWGTKYLEQDRQMREEAEIRTEIEPKQAND